MISTLEDIAAKVTSRVPLADDEAAALAATSDIIGLGMIADDARKARHGDRATFLRVVDVPVGSTPHSPLPTLTGEVRLVGVPNSAARAVTAVRTLRSAVDGSYRFPVSA